MIATLSILVTRQDDGLLQYSIQGTGPSAFQAELLRDFARHTAPEVSKDAIVAAELALEAEAVAKQLYGSQARQYVLVGLLRKFNVNVR